MTTGSVPITAGSGTEVATHTISEDGKTKHLQRFVPSTSGGVEILPATAAKQDAEALLLGAINETAPSTDTASSGVNGRLQRLAQRVTSLIALLPASIGNKARNASLSVALANEDRASLDQISTLLGTPATQLPPEPIRAETDLDPTLIAMTSATDVTIKAGVASQKHRTYRLHFTVSGATLVTLKSGSTVIDRWRFPATGGVVERGFSSRPWHAAAAGADLVLSSSAAVNIDGLFETQTAP